MFSKAFASILAVATLAITAQGAATAKTFSGDATYYHTGLGACGAVSKDSDFVVALSIPKFEAGHCWDHLKVTYQGKTIDVTVVDECVGCSSESIDLSPSAFQALAPLSAGRIPVTWQYA